MHVISAEQYREELQKHRSFGENTSVTIQAQVFCSLWNGSGCTNKGIINWLLTTNKIHPFQMKTYLKGLPEEESEFYMQRSYWILSNKIYQSWRKWSGQRTGQMLKRLHGYYCQHSALHWGKKADQEKVESAGSEKAQIEKPKITQEEWKEISQQSKDIRYKHQFQTNKTQMSQLDKEGSLNFLSMKLSSYRYKKLN